MEPICRIDLPSHHPAVAGLKKGESVHIVATKHEEPPSPFADKTARGAQAPPLQTPFHVKSITKTKAPPTRSANGKAQSPVQYLTSRRAQPPGGSVEDMD